MCAHTCRILFARPPVLSAMLMLRWRRGAGKARMEEDGPSCVPILKRGL